MNTYKVLDLFSGIGGFSLGLERAGMETVGFCESDGYACRVLRKHWPTIPIFEDVRTLTKTRLKHHGIDANVLCGGFPCQDLSYAGKGAGLAGKRSGLWSEYARLIREIRPKYAILENVPALRRRGLGQVLGDLAAIGYDAWWDCIPASALGAPHQRDRLWLVAYPRAARRAIGQRGGSASRAGLASPACLAHTEGARRAARRPGQRTAPHLGPGPGAPPYGRRWPAEPDVPRVVDGLPYRMDRLRCLGNSVVPQIVEMIGRAIIASESAGRIFDPPAIPETRP